MQYLMAIDAGTGSIRAVIFDTEGNQIALSQQEWFHLEEEGVANSMNFDFRQNWKRVCECIDDAITKAEINPADILELVHLHWQLPKALCLHYHKEQYPHAYL